MNTSDVKTIKMFGPALSGPARLVNRDVPVCDEQAYKAAGYKRGSIPEVSEAVSLEEPKPSPVAEAPIKTPAKFRKSKGQN